MKKYKHVLLLLIISFALTSCEKNNEEIKYINDIDGNIYNTIRIGNQLWMKENLRTTKYNDGASIVYGPDNVYGLDTLGYYWIYDHLESNDELYGKLYNGNTVSSGKLAPKGWHVATEADWIELENYLVKNGYNYNGSGEADEEKPPNYRIAKSLAISTGWESSDEEGDVGYMQESNNSTGFSAPPGGVFSFTTFIFDSICARWWCGDINSSEVSGNCVAIFYDSPYILITSGSKANYGFSIRCVKD